MRANVITRLAAAKLNLALHVTGRRADGYHLLESLVAFADFGDEVTVEPAETDEFVVRGPYASWVPIDDSNLVIAARDFLRDLLPGGDTPPVRISLDKRLPVASGVGGGSSDAAAAIKALIVLWGARVDEWKLAAAAVSLGADLPMCLVERPLIARGIGDEIEPLPTLPCVHAVLVNPGAQISTPEVFGALEKHDNDPLPDWPGANGALELARALTGLRNDLQRPAIEQCPAISDVLEALRANGAELSRMSGSGATCFGIFDGPGPAFAAADVIGKREPGWFVEPCLIRGT
ncbi:MAG: 4-(cytidine 5'-diphospho)-2-C-methyl-D-erythritol kinase [Rhizobiaceae bacterium]|nr:4-(cytidine 5'-diphospho)-2-C-methyl-D-erythritol kinase [Rhizobiaceae bacterium]